MLLSKRLVTNFLLISEKSRTRNSGDIAVKVVHAVFREICRWYIATQIFNENSFVKSPEKSYDKKNLEKIRQV